MSVVVPEMQGDERLDKFLSAEIPTLSRSRIQRLIAAGNVTRDGAPVRDAAYKVRAGETFEVHTPEPEPSDIRAVEITLRIVFEDEHLLVIDKPAGLTVHPAAGHRDDTLVNALLAHCGDSLSGIGGVARPGIVHRLDKDTSGLLVVAKHDKAHRSLARQIMNRTMKRTYLAVVWGVPKQKEGIVETRIGRSPKNRKKMAVVKSGGKEAVTHWKTVASGGLRVTSTEKPATRNSQLATATLVECCLQTGRTHQIRVHMAHLGHPLVDDPVYGSARATKKDAPEIARHFPRQALHACRLTFTHPATGETMTFQSDPPEDMKQLIERSFEEASSPITLP